MLKIKNFRHKILCGSKFSKIFFQILGIIKILLGTQGLITFVLQKFMLRNVFGKKKRENKRVIKIK